MSFVVIRNFVKNWKDKKSGENFVFDDIQAPYIASSAETAKEQIRALVTLEIENEVGKNNFKRIFLDSNEANTAVPRKDNFIYGVASPDGDITVFAVKEVEKIVSGYVWNSTEKDFIYVPIAKWFVREALNAERPLEEYFLISPGNLSTENAPTASRDDLMQELTAALKNRVPRLIVHPETGDLLPGLDCNKFMETTDERFFDRCPCPNGREMPENCAIEDKIPLIRDE